MQLPCISPASWAVQNTEQSLLPTTPGNILVPSTVEDVVSAVKTAAASGGNLRCIGHGNSWTPIFFDAVQVPTSVFSLSYPAIIGVGCACNLRINAAMLE